jgi:hypothetical protein
MPEVRADAMKIMLESSRGGPSDKCATCGHARSLHRPTGCSPNAVGGHRCECRHFAAVDEAPNVIPIGSARDQRVDGRYLELGGKTTFRKLAFGSVGVIGNARIQVIDASGRAFELTEAEARDVIEAFQHARRVAGLWREQITGFNAVRVTRHPSGSIDITHRGVTHRMRKLRTRRGRYCSACKVDVGGGGDFYVIADPGAPWNRIRFAEVCGPCVDRLATAPTNIRPLPTPSDAAKEGRS